MGNCHLVETYKCRECTHWGCEGHEATLDFQTTSEAYTLQIADQTIYLNEYDIRAMLTLLSRLSDERYDAIDPMATLRSLPWVSS